MRTALSRSSRLINLEFDKPILADRSSQHPRLQSIEAEISGLDCRRAFDLFPNIFSGSEIPKLGMILERVFTAERQQLFETAESSVCHRFSLAGSDMIDVGREIDWCSDYRSGYCWPNKNFRILKHHADGDADPYIPRALSRCCHFTSMALEYILTGRDAYPLEFECQVKSWTESNDYEIGVNWTSPTETALRSINWLLAYRLFASRWGFSDEFLRLLALELFKAGSYIAENLEVFGPGHNNSAYIANLTGLHYLGELFGSTATGITWRDLALRELEAESATQVDDEGFCQESSLAYQGLVAELLLYAQLLRVRKGETFSNEFVTRLQSMICVLERFTQGDGTVVSFGDCDDVRVLRMFGRAPRDFRDVISVGKRVLGMIALDIPACSPEELVVCDVDSARSGRYRIGSDLGSACLKDAGISQLRSRRLTLCFFANPVGSYGQGSHKHNDILSFTLEYRGQSVFVDPGTYTHLLRDGWLNQLRSTTSHNTVMIDGHEQNRMVGRFPSMLRNDSQPRIKLWKTDSESDLIVAENDGYLRLDDSISHRRAVFLDKQTEVVLIRDEINGSSNHEVNTHFLLDVPELCEAGHNCLRLTTGHSGEELLFALVEPNLDMVLSTHWIAQGYGLRSPGLKVTVKAFTQLPFTALYAITPLKDQELDSGRDLISKTRLKIGW